MLDGHESPNSVARACESDRPWRSGLRIVPPGAGKGPDAHIDGERDPDPDEAAVRREEDQRRDAHGRHADHGVGGEGVVGRPEVDAVEDEGQRVERLRAGDELPWRIDVPVEPVISML